MNKQLTELIGKQITIGALLGMTLWLLFGIWEKQLDYHHQEMETIIQVLKDTSPNEQTNP